MNDLLTSCDLTSLSSPFIDEEVKAMVFSLAKGKATVPDDFTVGFYQIYWDIIGRDITNLALTFSHNQVDLGRLNQACITLIPKKDNLENISDYKPISVISGMIKIISKLLVDRLQTHMSSSVDLHETTFVKKRSIMETFLVTRESIIFRKNRKYLQYY